MGVDSRAARGPAPPWLTERRTNAGDARSDARLLRAAQNGSDEALETLVRRSWPLAYRAAYLILRDGPAAEDVAQEALVAAIRALDRFDRRRPFGPWLHRIAVNRAIDHARARSARREVSSGSAEEAEGRAAARTAYPGPEPDPRASGLEAALAGLSPEHRAIVAMRYLLELTPGEIAAELGLPSGHGQLAAAPGARPSRRASGGRAMSDRREPEIADRLREVTPPDEREALDRAVALAAATASESPGPRSRPVRRRVVGGVTAAAAVIAAALVLTPAGATVRDWIDDAIDPAPPAPSRTTLGPIPGGGRLVVQSRAGPWVVDDDGSRRLLGDYDSATWSPRGLYLAATHGRSLTAVEPGGDARWSVETPGEARDPAWSTSGQRVAYRSGGDLHVVAGDGTLDRAVGPSAPHIAPSWMPVAEGPSSPNVVAYAPTPESLRVVDVDSAKVLAQVELPREADQIVWMDDEHVLVSGGDLFGIAYVDAQRFRSLPRPAGGGGIAGAAAPASGGRAVVLTEARRPGGEPRISLHILDIDPARAGVTAYRTIFTGIGRFEAPLISPDGTRALLGWRDADQWLFFAIGPRDRRTKPLSIGDVSRQFDPGATRAAARFPRVTGWCCP